MKNLSLAAAMIGLVSVGGCTEEEPETHGVVRIELSPQAGDVSMFNGTVEVVANLEYETCLQNFYLERNVGFQQTGPDGAAVFEEWAARLCDQGEFDNIADCEVTEIEQLLLEVNDVYTLRVTLQINDPSSLAYKELNVGPIPTEEFAACEDGLRPRVELRQSGLGGYDANGTQLWRIASLPASNVAVVGQGAPLRVDILEVAAP